MQALTTLIIPCEVFVEDVCSKLDGCSAFNVAATCRYFMITSKLPYYEITMYDMLICACENGYLGLIEYWLQRVDNSSHRSKASLSELACNAAFHGQVSILKWLQKEE